MNTWTIRLALIASSFAIVASACGSSPVSMSAETTTTVHEHSETGHDDDAPATPATDIADAQLIQGTFSVLPGAVAQATGTAWIARHANGTTVTVELSQLAPLTDFISHVHVAACGESGGEHYQFEAGGDHHPPNEIHLAFSSDADGEAMMTATNDAVARDDAVSIVVHVATDGAPKMLCADLVS